MRGSLAVAVALVALCAGAAAHDVPSDWSAESMPPGGAAAVAQQSVRYDQGTGSYLLTATDDRGSVTYRVTPGDSSGSTGLFSVACSMDGAGEFTITGGVMLSARDANRVEVMHDGTVRISALDTLDLDEDGPEGFMSEPAGNGPCIRLGNT
ncbi:MAG TPA: hypothetical protein VM283_05995, partial [Armatimonadota bacterium]|nr:hypothetical protein [Armatimonadota bacterium]